MPGAIRVLIADDDPLARQAIATILGSADDIVVAAEAADGTDVIPALQAHHCDVVLMDLRMPRQDGVAATSAARALPEPPHVIVLTSWDVSDAVVRSVMAGADGFLLKTAAPGDIVEAVRNVMAGEAVLSPRSTRQLVQHVLAQVPGDEYAEAAALMATLSDRERDVATAVADGLSNTAIAERLYLAVATVKSHLSAAQTKLGVDNRVRVAVLVERARAGA